MRKHLLFFVLLLFGQFAIGQIDTIKISGTKLISTRQILSNENKTKDTVLYLYRLDNRQIKLVKKFYLYKDEGGDCNNLFWNIGTMTTQNDSLIFLTRYLQKGHDPIPVIRKRIYQVAKSGELKLLFDKYKKRKDKEWRKVDYEGE
jgi:hypothetical protein